MDDVKNKIITKSGFLIYTDYWEKYFSKMSGDQIKEVFEIIFHFNKTFEVLKTNDLAVEMVVSTLIDNIKRDAEKRSKRSFASQENGRLGGRPKKSFSINTQDNPNNSEEKSAKKRDKFTPPSIEEVKQYCFERKNSVNAESFIDHYISNGWLVGKNKMKDWKAAVRNWEKNNNIYSNDKNIKQEGVKFNLLVDFINEISKDTLIKEIVAQDSKKPVFYFFNKQSYQKLKSLPEETKKNIRQEMLRQLGRTDFEISF